MYINIKIRSFTPLSKNKIQIFSVMKYILSKTRCSHIICAPNQYSILLEKNLSLSGRYRPSEGFSRVKDKSRWICKWVLKILIKSRFLFADFILDSAPFANAVTPLGPIVSQEGRAYLAWTTTLPNPNHSPKAISKRVI